MRRPDRAAVTRTQTELGSLDILASNAGVMLLGPIVDADTEDWRRMMSTHVLGLMYMTRRSGSRGHAVRDRPGEPHAATAIPAPGRQGGGPGGTLLM